MMWKHFLGFPERLQKYPHGTSNEERAPGLAFIPVLATLGYYALPPIWQSQLFIQFSPQLLAYLALGLWTHHNVRPAIKLGLRYENLHPGIMWGTAVGLLMGTINTFVLLYVIPALGMDIKFLSHTPYAHVPFWIMVPWFIIIIAMAVELNFRGFLLGRLLVCFEKRFPTHYSSPFRKSMRILLPLSISSLTFSFDPFMVTTFRQLHWIALWDGFIWGWIWLRRHNLYAVMTAHAVEVIMVYLIIRRVLA